MLSNYKTSVITVIYIKFSKKKKKNLNILKLVNLWELLNGLFKSLHTV